jgi:hypothetical protein
LTNKLPAIECETLGEKQVPLHYAAKSGSVDAVSCLIKDHGANKEAKDYLSKYTEEHQTIIWFFVILIIARPIIVHL